MKKWLASLKKNNYCFYIMLVVWVTLLFPMERYFFKRNGSFTIRFLHTTEPCRPEWDLGPLSEAQDQLLDQILAQPFSYLGKGAHCYAFLSQDQQYVIKFHRFPSHMRPLPWLTHPFSFCSKKRIAIKNYNLENYAYYMSNYKNSYQDLQEETGVLFLHINRSDPLNKTITLIDKSKNAYHLPLDEFTFILQRKAQLIYPTLEEYLSNNQIDQAKQAITHIVDLIVATCKKGYINNDPILKRNYGLMADRAIFIDIGDLSKDPTIADLTNTLSHFEKATMDLRAWAASKSPELLSHFELQRDLSMQELFELRL